MKKNRKIFFFVLFLLLLTSVIFFFVPKMSPARPPALSKAPQKNASPQLSSFKNQPETGEASLSDSAPSLKPPSLQKETHKTANTLSPSAVDRASSSVSFQTDLLIRTIRQGEIISSQPTKEERGRLHHAIQIFSKNYQALLVFNADGSTLNGRSAALYCDPALDITPQIKIIYLSLLQEQKNQETPTPES
jgi:hypothetical protein